MKYRPLGRTGITVSSVCLGTMTYGEQNTEAEGHAQMDMALERGVNFFDMAELYSIPPKPETQGSTERIVGSWMKARGNRDKVVIATKIVGRTGMSWFRKDGAKPRQTRAQIDEAIESSLKRLQTDYIDLYQLHWPDRKISQLFGGHIFEDLGTDMEPFEDILSALDRHVEKGTLRAIGVSNETSWGTMRFLQESEKRGLPRIASIQNAYNLVNRSFEIGLAEIAVREDVSLLAYSPLGQGYLSGKYRNGALPAGSRKAMFERLGRYEGPGAQETLNRYLDLAHERGMRPEHLALKFCDTRAFMTSTIIGATNLTQLETDLEAFDAQWSDDLETAVNAIHASHPNPCP